MFKDLQKKLNKYGLNLNEPMVSMALGAAVVVLIGVLAYNYFRNYQPATPNIPAEVEEVPEAGELTGPTAAVALPTTHKVVAGETLWSIAEKYYASGYNFMDIAEANKLADVKSIEVDQTLTIPKVSPRQPLTVSQAVQAQVTDSKITGDRYVVLDGDYLWSIAVRAYGDGYRWVDIAKANNLASPDLIHPGNTLQIPR